MFLWVVAAIAAAPPPVLVIADDARASLEATVRLTQDGTLVDVDERFRTQAEASTDSLDRSFAELPGLLRALDFAGTRARLDAIQRTLSSSDWRSTATLWLKLWALQGFTSHLENENAPPRGTAEVVAAFSIDPALQVELPKAERFGRWLDEQRAEASRTPRVAHRITSAEPMLVWVDGQLRGVTPVELTLAVGPHLMVGAARWRERVQLRVEVVAGSVTELPGGAPLTEAALARRTALLEAVQREGALPDPSWPSLVVVRLGGALSAQRFGAGRATAPVPVELSSGASVLAALDAGAPSPRAQVRAASLVSFVTAAVLALGAGVAFGVAQSTFGSARDVPQLDTAGYGRLMNDGRTAMAVSGGLLGAALLGAGLGLFFTFD
ncbi:MAG: hypothetical protein Q8S33_10935 [Myxococcales bacterium]|nr:hypothetical protein [Myxococcales bacterium]